MTNPFPLNISTKQNTPELLAFFQQFGNEWYLSAEEINKIDAALSYLYQNITGNALEGLISSGIITRSGNVFSFSIGFVGIINDTTVQNSISYNLTIPSAASNNYRIDIAVLNQDGEIVLVSGNESEDIATQPDVPSGTIFLTSWIIFGDLVSNESPVIVSSQFVKKAEFAENNVTGSGAITLNLNSEQTAFRLASNSITVVEGTNPTSNYINTLGYTGKLLTIINSTASNKTIKHSTDAWGFRFPNNADFVLGVNEVLTMRQTKTDAPHFDVLAVGRMVTDSLQNLQSVLSEGNSASFTGASGIFFITMVDADTGMHEVVLEQVVGGFIYNQAQTLQAFSHTKSDEITLDYKQAVCGVTSNDADDPTLNIQKYISDNTAGATGLIAFDLPEAVLDKYITFTPYLSSYNGARELRNCSEFLRLRTAHTLTNTTSLQKIFNTGTNGNGAFNVFNGKRYRLTVMAGFSNLTGTSKTMAFGILGTATGTNVFGISNSLFFVSPMSNQQTIITSFASTAITATAVFGNANTRLEMEFECTLSGTIIPCVSFTAAQAGMTTVVGSYCTLEEVGNDTDTHSLNTD